MIRKSSTEVRNIFDMDRHELDRYRKSGIISTVEEVGQGQTSYYSEKDLHRLLELKLLHMSGYTLSDFKERYAHKKSEKLDLDEQIYEYKRRIHLLELVKLILTQEESYHLSNRQWLEFGRTGLRRAKAELKELKIPGLDYWDIFQVIFSVDRLCCKKSISTEPDGSKKSRKSIVDICNLVKPSNHEDSVELCLELKSICEEVLEEAKPTGQRAKEISDLFIDAYNADRSRFVSHVLKKIEAMSEEGSEDKQVETAYRDFTEKLYIGVIDLVMDGQGLYYLLYNLLECTHYIDLDALEKGNIQLAKEGK